MRTAFQKGDRVRHLYDKRLIGEVIFTDFANDFSLKTLVNVIWDEPSQRKLYESRVKPHLLELIEDEDD